MADRIRRLKKEDKKLPKNPHGSSGADLPRRISHGVIGVRKMRRSSTNSNSSNGSAKSNNPFADLMPHQRSSVSVLTNYDQHTGRTTHLRRKSKVKGISRALAQSRASAIKGISNKDSSTAISRDTSAIPLQNRSAPSSTASSPATSPQMNQRPLAVDRDPTHSIKQPYKWGKTKPSPKMAAGGWGSRTSSPSPRQGQSFDNNQIAPQLSLPIPDLARLQKGQVAERIQQFSPTSPIINTTIPSKQVSVPQVLEKQRSMPVAAIKHISTPPAIALSPEEQHRQATNDKIDRFLASLGAPKPSPEGTTTTNSNTSEAVSSKINGLGIHTAEEHIPIVSKVPTTSCEPTPSTGGSWSTSSSPISTHSILPHNQQSPLAVAVSNTSSSPRRWNGAPLDLKTEQYSKAISGSPGSLRSPSSPTRRAYMEDGEEMFRGVKVSWLLKTYNDYMESKKLETSQNQETKAALPPAPQEVIAPKETDDTSAPRILSRITPEKISSRMNAQTTKETDLRHTVTSKPSPAGPPVSLENASVLTEENPASRPLGPARTNTSTSQFAVPMSRGRSAPSDKERPKEVVPAMPQRSTSRPATLSRPPVPSEPVPVATTNRPQSTYRPDMRVQKPLIDPVHVEAVPQQDQAKTQADPKPPIEEDVTPTSVPVAQKLASKASALATSPRLQSLWKPLNQVTGLWSSQTPPVPQTNGQDVVPTPPPSANAPMAIPQGKAADERAEMARSPSPTASLSASPRARATRSSQIRSKSQGPDRKRLVSNNVSFYDPFASKAPPVPVLASSPKGKRTPSPLQSSTPIQGSSSPSIPTASGLYTQVPRTAPVTVNGPSTISVASSPSTESTAPTLPTKPYVSPVVRQTGFASQDPTASPSRTVRRIMKQQMASPPPSPSTLRDEELLAYPAKPKINEGLKQMSMLGLATASDEGDSIRAPSRARNSDSSEDELLPKTKKPIARGVSTKAQKLLGMSTRGAAFEAKQRGKRAINGESAAESPSHSRQTSTGGKSRTSNHSAKQSASSIMKGKSISSLNEVRDSRRLVTPLDEEAVSIFDDPILSPDMQTYGSPSPVPGQYARSINSISDVAVTPRVESVGGHYEKHTSRVRLEEPRNNMVRSPSSDTVATMKDNSQVDDYLRRPSSVYAKNSPIINEKTHQKSYSAESYYTPKSPAIVIPTKEMPNTDEDDGGRTPTKYDQPNGMFTGFSFGQRNSQYQQEAELEPSQKATLSPHSASNEFRRGSAVSSIGTLDTKERMQKSRDSSFGSAASLPLGPSIHSHSSQSSTSNLRARFAPLEPIEQSPLVGRDTDSIKDQFNAISRESTPPTPAAAEFKGLGLGISSNGSTTVLDQILHAETAPRPRPQRVTTLDRINSSAQNPQAAARIQRPPIPQTTHFIPPNYPTSRSQRPTSVHSTTSNVSNKSGNVPISYYQPRSDQITHDPFRNLDLGSSNKTSRRPSSVPSLSTIKTTTANQYIDTDPKSSVDSSAGSEHEYILRPPSSTPKLESPRTNDSYYDPKNYEYPPSIPMEHKSRPSPVIGRSNSIKRKSRPATQMNSNEVHEKFDIRRALANSSDEDEVPRKVGKEEEGIIGMAASSATAALSKWFG